MKAEAKIRWTTRSGRTYCVPYFCREDAAKRLEALDSQERFIRAFDPANASDLRFNVNAEADAIAWAIGYDRNCQ